MSGGQWVPTAEQVKEIYAEGFRRRSRFPSSLDHDPEGAFDRFIARIASEAAEGAIPTEDELFVMDGVADGGARLLAQALRDRADRLANEREGE